MCYVVEEFEWCCREAQFHRPRLLLFICLWSPLVKGCDRYIGAKHRPFGGINCAAAAIVQRPAESVHTIRPSYEEDLGVWFL